MVREAAAVVVAAVVVGAIGRPEMDQPTVGSVQVLGKGQLPLGSADDGSNQPTLGSKMKRCNTVTLYNHLDSIAGLWRQMKVKNEAPLPPRKYVSVFEGDAESNT
jgi:hypothetical protein